MAGRGVSIRNQEEPVAPCHTPCHGQISAWILSRCQVKRSSEAHAKEKVTTDEMPDRRCAQTCSSQVALKRKKKKYTPGNSVPTPTIH